MRPLNQKTILAILGIFLVIEILSFFSLGAAFLNIIVFGCLALATLILAFYKLEYGLLMVLAELFIGSMGHLFDLNVAAFQLSIRIALFVILLTVYAVKFLGQLIKSKSQSVYWQSLKNFSGRKIFGLLFLFIVIGVINGFWHHHSLSLIWTDFNAWPYFLILLPAVAVYGQAAEGALARLFNLFLAGAIWISLKTLFLLFVFTHDLSSSLLIYSWLRRTLVGEMTPTLGGWPRVFIQGQIYPAIAFFALFWFQAARFKIKALFKRQSLFILILAALFLSSILISFSRSFWVGLSAAFIFSFILIALKYSFKKSIQTFVWFISVGAFSFLIIYLTVAFPYWHARSENFSVDFLERATNTDESAITSRWSLLPALTRAIFKEPILGQGYGATVTYFSSDPRVLQNNPSGRYTTYAFEWGYLEVWLKLGILGLAVYLWLLFKMIKDSLKRARSSANYLFFALPTGIIFLAATNLFTPYFNHPLGIGFFVLSSCLIWANRVY